MSTLIFKVIKYNLHPESFTDFEQGFKIQPLVKNKELF